MRHRREPFRPVSYSGTDVFGSTRPAAPDRRYVLAITESSRVLFGLLASGTRSGSVVAMNGTSVAAPQLTRQIAWRYLGGPGPGAERIEDDSDADRELLLPDRATQQRLDRRRGGKPLQPSPPEGAGNAAPR